MSTISVSVQVTVQTLSRNQCLGKPNNPIFPDLPDSEFSSMKFMRWNSTVALILPYLIFYSKIPKLLAFACTCKMSA